MTDTDRGAGFINGEHHWPHAFENDRCECGLVLITIKAGQTAHPLHAMIAHHHATAHLCGSGYCSDCDAAIDEDTGEALTDILCAVTPEPNGRDTNNPEGTLSERRI